jgi:multisubunit Na+/H+ antiporter MnhC subunit
VGAESLTTSRVTGCVIAVVFAKGAGRGSLMSREKNKGEGAAFMAAVIAALILEAIGIGTFIYTLFVVLNHFN